MMWIAVIFAVLSGGGLAGYLCINPIIARSGPPVPVTMSMAPAAPVTLFAYAVPPEAADGAAPPAA